MVVLGLDYGEKRIGVAVARQLAGLAEPVAVVETMPKAVETIKQVVKKYQVELVVVGISEGRMAKESRKFGEKLEQAGLKVEFYDETLSSKEAEARLKHKSRGFRSKPQDAFQAAVMLEDWVDVRGLMGR